MSTHTCSSPNQKSEYEKDSGSQLKNVPRTSSTLNKREETLSTLTLPYSEDELTYFVNFRTTGLAKKSCDWILLAARHLWCNTGGIISQETVEQFRATILTKYKSEWSYGKTLAFARSFLKYLTRIRLDTRYHAFCIFLERPKHVKARKAVTSRIVTREDVENVLERIRAAEREGRISSYRALQYTAFVLFGAFTGQRSMATISRLNVGQFKTAVKMERPVLQVLSHQDKIRMEHYCPLHPRVIAAISPLLDGRRDNELMFVYNSLQMWVKREKIPLSRTKGNFVLSDLRKFAEQYGDIILWDQSNRAYILTHGVSGVVWAHYKHPLPEYVYDIYMKYWKGVSFFR